jgi:hypothetical protein
MLGRAMLMEEPCYDLPGTKQLQVALQSVRHLLNDWVNPQLSVGPSARQAHALAVSTEDADLRIASLKPLPSDWLPADGRQRAVYRKVNKT